MSAKTATFTAFGVTYRTTQFTAIPALVMMSRQNDWAPPDMLSKTEVKDEFGEWIKLDNRDAINKYVLDASGALAPIFVLRGVLSLVNEFNFDFMMSWKGVRVPRRLIDEAQNVSSSNVDPMVAQLISNEAATLRELEEYYSLEDAFKMFDVLTAKGVNQALSQEASAARSRRR